jgi:hypothetical protein
MVTLTLRTCALVRRVLPQARERVITGWRIVAYEAPRVFAYVVPLVGAVAVGFNRGAELDDPAGTLERVGRAAGARRRTLRRLADLRDPALTRLLREAFLLEQLAPARPMRAQSRRRR